MDLTTSHYIQLIIALSLGIVVFLSGQTLPERFTVSALIILIPFQIIDSRYGTLNIILTYTLFASFFLTKRIRSFPLLGSILLIMLSYFLTIIQVHKTPRFHDIIYIVSIVSNFLLFFITYNYIVNQNDIKAFFKLIIAINILIIFYNFFQLIIGTTGYKLFGIEEFALETNKAIHAAQETRMRGGAFGAVGLNAEYLMIQILTLAYLLMREGKRLNRNLYFVMIALNFLFLVGTGSRTAFFTLIIGMMLFFIFYFKEIGLTRTVGMNIGLIVTALLMSFLVMHYTEYSNVFDRISASPQLIKKGLPDTRTKVWSITWELIKEQPVLGHGPRMKRTKSGFLTFNAKTGTALNAYPHSLYLFILYTLGMVGLAAYSCFWLQIYRKFRRARDNLSNDKFLDGLPKLGMIILLVFLISQVTFEFLRFKLSDYQHYIFMLFGAFIGICDIISNKSANPRNRK